MKIYSNKNVYEAALERIRFIFDEFENVVVSFSGGKDSTVIFNLAYQVAKEKGRLPLTVMFIDQEAEWNETISYVKTIMYNKDVMPLWFQMPIRILNATSNIQNWLYCWKEGEKWLREKEDISFKVNDFGTDRFHECFDYILAKLYDGKRVANLGGVRCEESPGRQRGLTCQATYKWVTWGKKLKTKDHFTFYPVYDWSYTDVWKFICDNKIEYNKIYDLQYRYGVKVSNMRVSNLHHETAVQSLFYLQELDQGLYSKLTERISGIDTAGKLNKDDYYVRDLPFMFKDWKEYYEYLKEKLVNNPDFKKLLEKYAKTFFEIFDGDRYNEEKVCKIMISSILANDIECTKLQNFRVAYAGLYKKNKKIWNLEHPKNPSAEAI